jgi:hypothetical protein
MQYARGIVKDGQVVFDQRLDFPDGTVVTVTPCDVGEPHHVRPPAPLTGEVLAELAAFWRREKTWEEAEQRIRELQARP